MSFFSGHMQLVVQFVRCGKATDPNVSFYYVLLKLQQASVRNIHRSVYSSMAFPTVENDNKESERATVHNVQCSFQENMAQQKKQIKTQNNYH